jgi:hypothetical protein
MIRDELQRSVLNCDMPQVLASGKNGKRLWMKCNPALGTMIFTVMVSGRAICETLSLNKAINAYNAIGKENAA